MWCHSLLQRMAFKLLFIKPTRIQELGGEGELGGKYICIYTRIHTYAHILWVFYQFMVSSLALSTVKMELGPLKKIFFSLSVSMILNLVSRGHRRKTARENGAPPPCFSLRTQGAPAERVASPAKGSRSACTSALPGARSAGSISRTRLRQYERIGSPGLRRAHPPPG